MPQPAPDAANNPVATADLARTFFKMGCLGFGGPLAHVALMQQEVVEKHQWLSSQSFAEGLTLSQVLPGPLSTKLAIYLGYKHKGMRGALITTAGFILPAFFLLLVLTDLYFRFGAVPGPIKQAARRGPLSCATRAASSRTTPWPLAS